MSAVPPTASPLTRGVFRSAVALVAGTVVLGSVVCATEASAACPTWPGCYPGRVIPRAEALPMIEGIHRAVAILTGPAILLACILGLRVPQRDARWRVLPWVALIGAGCSAALGMATVLWGLPRWLAIFDLGCALVALFALTIATDALLDPRPVRRWDRLPWLAWAAVVLVHLSGVLLAGEGSYTRCMGWPLAPTNGADLASGAQLARFALAMVAAGLVVALAVVGRRTSPAGPTTALMARVAALLLVAEVLLGFWLRATEGARALNAVYSVLAGLIVWALGVAVARARD